MPGNHDDLHLRWLKILCVEEVEWCMCVVYETSKLPLLDIQHIIITHKFTNHMEKNKLKRLKHSSFPQVTYIFYSVLSNLGFDEKFHCQDDPAK